ncbi:hypothetical protein CLVI_00600 [Clostridium vincentii]|uniref:Uncharacterized protein n=1 Tax=Clostridium vincentii TaxID=52704 RepID=A0A2T0BKZ2_9CLOT|nr:hypothetical protein CLVI_00600 [Clostridium vincentii]
MKKSKKVISIIKVLEIITKKILLGVYFIVGSFLMINFKDWG